VVAVEELPGAIGDNSPFADEVDEIQANESREIGLTHVWRTACAFPKVKESHMNIFTIIGVIVVIVFVLGYFGLR
jgi:hypothetical protein